MSVTFGSEHTERMPVSQVRQSLLEYLDLVRLVAAVIGGVGILYALLAMAQSPVAVEMSADSPKADPRGPSGREE